MDHSSALVSSLHLIHLDHDSLLEPSSEMSRLRPSADRLETETGDLRDINRYQPSSTPIQKLPPELLIKILLYSFTWALAIDQPRRVPTLRLAQVCSSWRGLVLSNGVLWSSLYISRSCMNTRSLELMRVYLERSGNSPLTLYIDDSAFHFHSDIGTEMLVLLDHSTRWRYITFLSHSVFFLNDWPLPSENCPISFPELKSVEFIDKFDFLFRYGSIANAFKDASQLCQLQLYSFPITHPLHKDYFQLSQLTTLVIQYNYCHVVDLLLLCPLLQKLETSVYALGRTSTENVVCHDSLRELTLRFDTFASISGSLRAVQLPNLLSVELFSIVEPHVEFAPRGSLGSVCRRPLFWLPDGFLSFLKNSACSLTNLSFRTFKIAEPDLELILKLTPCLIHFSLHEYGPSLGTELLSSLTRSQENPIPLLPQLSHLEVHWRGYMHGPDDILRLVAMVESRIHSKSVGLGGTRMRKFAFNFRYDPTQQGYVAALSRMKALCVSTEIDVSVVLARLEPLDLSSR